MSGSIKDLADVGAELWDRLHDIAREIDPVGTWADQPQYVRDKISILFAMVRNRTEPALVDALVESLAGWEKFIMQEGTPGDEQDVARIAEIRAKLLP